MTGFSKKIINIRYYNKWVRRFKHLTRAIIYKLGCILFFYQIREFDIPYHQVKRILFISLYYRGDLLFHTTVLKLLKLMFNNAEIDVWIKSRSKGILDGNKDVNDIIIFDGVKTDENFDMFNFKYRAKLEFLRTMKCKKYDLVIDYTGLFQQLCLLF